MRTILLLWAVMLILVLSACNQSGSGAEPKQLSAQAQRGEHVFKMQCAVCHNANSTEPLHGPGMRGLYKRQELPSGVSLTDEHVKLTIERGRNMMPPMPLDQGQVDDVVAYLKTL